MSAKMIAVVILSFLVITKAEAATLDTKPNVCPTTAQVCEKAYENCWRDYQVYKQKRDNQKKPLDPETHIWLQNLCTDMRNSCLKSTN